MFDIFLRSPFLAAHTDFWEITHFELPLEARLWISDTVTKTRFQRQFKVGDFPEVGDLGEVFGVVKQALQSSNWEATYPKNNGESIQIEIDNGVLKISLPPVDYVEEDVGF